MLKKNAKIDLKKEDFTISGYPWWLIRIQPVVKSRSKTRRLRLTDLEPISKITVSLIRFFLGSDSVFLYGKMRIRFFFYKIRSGSRSTSICNPDSIYYPAVHIHMQSWKYHVCNQIVYNIAALY